MTAECQAKEAIAAMRRTIDKILDPNTHD